MKPPSPKGTFLLGNTKAFAFDTIGYIQNCMDQWSEEGIVYSRIAFKDFYIFLKPDYVDHVLQKNHKNYVKSFAYDGLKEFLGNGLLTSEGDFWAKQRKLIQPAFYKDVIETMKSGMIDETNNFINQLDNESIDMNRSMMFLTGEIVRRTLFGIKTDDELDLFDDLQTLRNYANDRMKNPLMLPSWVPTSYNIRFAGAIKRIDKLIYHEIEKNNDYEIGNNVLTMLLSVEDEETGEKMSDKQIRDEAITLFIAGQETTSNALTFLFYLISKHPEVEERLVDEIGKAFKSNAPFSKDKMPYVEATIHEALRLYPPAWAISRKALDTDQIGDYEIPKGSTVFLSIYAIHRDPDFWSSPDEFIPDRFLDGNYDKQAYLPFGKGPRTCIGSNFALLEIKIVLSLLLNKYKFTRKSSFEPELRTPMTLSWKANMHFDISRRS